MALAQPLKRIAGLAFAVGLASVAASLPTQPSKLDVPSGPADIGYSFGSSV